MAETRDVFISYSSVDREAAESLCATLEKQNIGCWMAPRDIAPGSEWAGSIIRAINGARVFVLIYSEHSNASVQVKREVERAANREIPIIPFRLANVTPNETLEFFISTPHWIDAHEGTLEAAALLLAGAIQAQLGQAPTAQPAQAAYVAPAAPAEGPPDSPRSRPRRSREGRVPEFVAEAIALQRERYGSRGDRRLRRMEAPLPAAMTLASTTRLAVPAALAVAGFFIGAELGVLSGAANVYAVAAALMCLSIAVGLRMVIRLPLVTVIILGVVVLGISGFQDTGAKLLASRLADNPIVTEAASGLVFPGVCLLVVGMIIRRRERVDTMSTAFYWAAGLVIFRGAAGLFGQQVTSTSFMQGDPVAGLISALWHFLLCFAIFQICSARSPDRRPSRGETSGPPNVQHQED